MIITLPDNSSLEITDPNEIRLYMDMAGLTKPKSMAQELQERLAERRVEELMVEEAQEADPELGVTSYVVSQPADLRRVPVPEGDPTPLDCVTVWVTPMEHDLIKTAKRLGRKFTTVRVWDALGPAGQSFHRSPTSVGQKLGQLRNHPDRPGILEEADNSRIFRFTELGQHAIFKECPVPSTKYRRASRLARRMETRLREEG